MTKVLQLETPVEFGDLQLAPTTELAGLAELALLKDHVDQLEAVVRIAAAVRAEDDERARIAAIYAGDASPTALPQRR
jgi:hypothetical protein